MKKLLLFIFIFSIVGACSPKKINNAAIAVSKLDADWWKNRHEKILSQLGSDPKLILIGNSITHTIENEDRREVREKYLDKYRALGI